MKSTLLKIKIPSRYGKKKAIIDLPDRLAYCTPDTYVAIMALAAELAASGGALILSDLFRSYNAQKEAHNDFVTGRKSAYSPAPGGSMHEAGRGMDLELNDLGMKLKNFWPIAAKHGFFPVIEKPDSSMKEAWHFDLRGSHARVYDYYRAERADNLSPYKAMAVSAILAIGEPVDDYRKTGAEAAIQAGLIRLGFDPGNIDGQLGLRSYGAIKSAGITPNDPVTMLAEMEKLLLAAYPSEFQLP